MLNILISFACSALTSALMIRFVTTNQWIVGGAALVVFFAVFLLTARLVMKKLGDVMQQAQRDVMANRSEKAVRDLQTAMKFNLWQFYIKQQINSQIGSIYYIKRDFNDAIPYLEKGFVRHWAAMSMLAVSYMKKNKPEKMKETFEKTIAGSRKEPMVYALFAYCLDHIHDRAQAIEVLKKGIKKTNGDERLKENVDLLEAGKRMKMKGFGDMWYQFHLEKQGAIIKKQTKAMTGRRKQVIR